MLITGIIILCIMAWIVFAVYTILKTHKNAKENGTPGCVGCSSASCCCKKKSE